MRHYNLSLRLRTEETTPLVESFCRAFEARYPDQKDYNVGMYDDGELYIAIAGNIVFEQRELI